MADPGCTGPNQMYAYADMDKPAPFLQNVSAINPGEPLANNWLTVRHASSWSTCILEYIVIAWSLLMPMYLRIEDGRNDLT